MLGGAEAAQPLCTPVSHETGTLRGSKNTSGQIRKYQTPTAKGWKFFSGLIHGKSFQQETTGVDYCDYTSKAKALPQRDIIERKCCSLITEVQTPCLHLPAFTEIASILPQSHYLCCCVTPVSTKTRQNIVLPPVKLPKTKLCGLVCKESDHKPVLQRNCGAFGVIQDISRLRVCNSKPRVSLNCRVQKLFKSFCVM